MQRLRVAVGLLKVTNDSCTQAVRCIYVEFIAIGSYILVALERYRNIKDHLMRPYSVNLTSSLQVYQEDRLNFHHE